MFGPRAGKAPNPRALPIGGCDFVAEPDLDWRHTPVFWRADIADDVVCFLNVDPSLSSDFTGQDIEESAHYRRAAQDGLYMNWLSGDQAWLLPPVRLDLPIVAASPLDGSFPRRTAAAVRIWRRTRGQPSTKAPGPSLRRRDYLTRALRALCGRLPYSSLAPLLRSVEQTRTLLADARKLAYDVGDIDAAFRGRYGEARMSDTDAELVAKARERWQTSLAAFEDSLKVQAGVVGNLATNRAELEELVGRSQGATGALQASQAGNQLLALQTQQLTDLTATLAAIGRAQAIDAAQRAAAASQAKEQMRRFLTPGPGYRPTDIEMFP